MKELDGCSRCKNVQYETHTHGHHLHDSACMYLFHHRRDGVAWVSRQTKDFLATCVHTRARKRQLYALTTMPRTTQPHKASGGKRLRAKKDPNAPKRPPSSYILFLNAVRPVVLAKHPTKKWADLAQYLSGMWKNLADSSKEPFRKHAAILKEAYLKKAAQFKANLAKKRAPKRAPSSYFIFMASVRSQIKHDFPYYSVSEISKHIGAMWKALTPEEKRPFEAEANEKKRVYLEAKKKWDEENLGDLDFVCDSTDDESESSGAE